MARDFYEVLGVSKKASADEIKKAYRKLARKYDPGDMPALRRSRSRQPEPGLLLDQPTLPAVRWSRADRRVAVRDLRRVRAHAPAQALPGEGPGRRPRRDPHPGRRQGRGRAAR